MKKSKNPIYATDLVVISKKIAKLQETMLQYLIRDEKHQDDFMLRVDLYDLQRTIEEIRERHKETTNE